MKKKLTCAKTDLQFVDAVETRWFPRRPAAHTRPLHLFSLSSPRRASFPSVHLLATRAAPSAPMWVVEARQRASPVLFCGGFLLVARPSDREERSGMAVAAAGEERWRRSEEGGAAGLGG